jgi:hypothetical protein
VLGKRVTLQIPLLIEAEKAGINAALEDLDKFCGRSMLGTMEGGESSFIEIPMLVVTKPPGHKTKRRSSQVRVDFQIREVPFL